MPEDVKKCPCEAMIQVQKDIRAHDGRLATGDTNFKVMDLRLQTISDDTKEIKQDVKGITLKPAKRWDGFVDKVMNVVIVIILGYIATHMGLQ
jgi:hypothetical protein